MRLEASKGPRHPQQHADSAKKWWVLASVACGTFMATLDSSIVNIALPTLTKEFGADLNQIKWVVNVYLLVNMVLLLPFGRLSDQVGRKLVFSLGYLVFGLGSMLCGFSGSLLTLVGFRALQGVGAAMLMVNGPAIITATFPATERGGALGTLAMVVSAGLLSGPSIGGFLITVLGWRSIFWVNLPIALAGTLLVYHFVRKDLCARRKAPFDWVGAFMQLVLLVSLITFFDPPQISISGSGPIAIPRWVIAVFVAVLGLLFIRVESDAAAPVFDLALLGNRTFAAANLAGFFVAIAFSTVSVLMPFFLEDKLGFGPNQAGLYMTAIPLTIFIVAPISGRLSDRFSGPELSFAGAMIGGIALLVMSGLLGAGLAEDVTPGGIILALGTIGFSMGLFQSPNNNSIMTASPAAKLGVASAFLATVRNLGLIVGNDVATGIFTWRRRVTGDFTSSLHTALLVASGVAFLGMLACLGKQTREKTEARIRKQGGAT